MSYTRKTNTGVVFFDSLKKNSAFQKRLEHGKVGEVEVANYVKKYIKKNGIDKHFKVWDCESFVKNVMGMTCTNITDALMGDILISYEYKKNYRELRGRLDTKWSNDALNSSIGYHGTPTDAFNSYTETFYVTKANDNLYAIWGQDLVGIPRDGNSLHTSDSWWSKGYVARLLIPLDDVLNVIFMDLPWQDKCDLIESLRQKYHHIKPRSVAMIQKEQQENNAINTITAKETVQPVKEPRVVNAPRIVKLYSKRPGYYATVGVDALLEAEKFEEDTIFELSYCPKGKETKPAAKLYFSSIRGNWKPLVKGDNRFIKSIDLREYLSIE
jgi:hypothetical protein